MFETDPLYYSLVSYFHSTSTPHYTTLPHFFHHLHRLHHLCSRVSDLDPRLKPIAYRSISFIPGHQSCYYDVDVHVLHFNDYVTHATNTIDPNSTKLKSVTFPNSTTTNTFPHSNSADISANSKSADISANSNSADISVNLNSADISANSNSINTFPTRLISTITFPLLRFHSSVS